MTAYDNTGVITEMIISNTSFSGAVINTGTISPSGIHVLNSIVHGIRDMGIIDGGIWIDEDSTLNGTEIGISISSNFSGGIVNNGAIAGAALEAIQARASTFLGGIANSGTIRSLDQTAIQIYASSLFSGDVNNSGIISSASGGGALSLGASTISGGITNSGTISSGWSESYALDVGGDFYNDGITNSGTIFGGINGIFVNFSCIFSGGIINAAGGIISGHDEAIYIGAINPGTFKTFTGGISNAGTLAGGSTYSTIVSVSSFIGGVDNSGVISGTISLDASDFSGGIDNSGTVFGNIDVSASTFTGGITNTGTLSGGILLSGTPSVSVFDAGVVSGGFGPFAFGKAAVQFGTGLNTLTLGPGYDITGGVYGTGSDTLQLGGTGNGHFDLNEIIDKYPGSGFVGFSNFEVVGGTWTVSGTGQGWNIESGALLLDDNGTLSNTSVSSGGTLCVLSGQLDGAVISAGGVAIDPIIGADLLQLDQGAVESGQITFASESSASLEIDGTTMPTGAIDGFAPGDVIDLAGVNFASGASATLDSGNELHVTVAGEEYSLQLDQSQDFSGDSFKIQSDGSSGTEIEVSSGGFSVSFSGPLTEGSSGTLIISDIPAPTSATTIQLAIDAGTAPASDIVGLPSSVVLSAGQATVTEGFQIEADPLAANSSETFSVSATSPIGNATASGDIDEFVTAPYEFTIPGGGFSYDTLGQQMTATGTVNVALSDNPGTSLLTISNGSASYNGSSFTGSGTVYEDETGKNYALFQGSFTLLYSGSETSTSSLTDIGAFAGKFDLGGLPVTFTQLTLLPDALLAAFSLALPFSDSTSIMIDTSSWGLNYGLSFNNAGPQFVLGGSVSLPDLGPVDVFGIFTGSLTNESVTYLAASDTLQLQGIFTATDIFGTNAQATVNFSGDNYIQFQDGRSYFNGSLSITGINYSIPGFKLNQVDLSINSNAKTFSGDAAITMPFGATLTSALVSGSSPLVKVTLGGSWNNNLVINSVGIAFSNLAIPLGGSSVVWTGANIGISNMFAANAPVTFSGGLSFGEGTAIAGNYPATLTVAATGSSQQLSGSEELEVAPYNFVSALTDNGVSPFQSIFPVLDEMGTVTANYANGTFQSFSISGTEKIFGGAIVTTLALTTNANLDIKLDGSATVNFGNSLFGTVINSNVLAAALGSAQFTANFALSYTNGAALTQDYAKAWATLVLPYSFSLLSGENTVSVGVTVNFEGQVSGDYSFSNSATVSGNMASSSAMSDAVAFSANPAATYLFLTASWTNAATAPVMLSVTDPNNTTYQQSEFAADNIEVVSALTTAYDETLMVVDPDATTGWTVQVTDGGSLGVITVTSAVQETGPSINSVSLGTVSGGSELGLSYNLSNASSATLSIYADQDGQNFDGILLSSNSSAGNGNGSIEVSLSDLNDGLWHVYGLVSDGISIPAEDYTGEDLLITSGQAEIVSPVKVGVGETLTISPGQTSAALDIRSGATVYVAAGGTVLGTIVEGGGTLTVQSGGTADPTIVSSGGTEVVNPGGTDLGALVQGGGLQIVHGTVSGVTVSGGGEQYVGAGGSSLAAQVQGGGAEVVFGTESGADVSGTQYDFGSASGGTTESGGYQLVAPGAVAIGMTVAFGGQQYVGMGGTTLSAQVKGGGAEVVFGTDGGASLSGTQYLYGTASGGTTFNGGYQLVASGATASGMTVESGGYQYIGAGGTAVATQIVSQGAQIVFGSALGALVSGTQYDFAYASGGTTYNNGFQEVAPGATAIGMTVEVGGQQYVGSGGTALATNIAAGGVEQIFGSDSGALVSGTQYVFGTASGGTTFNGGYQLVAPAGAGTALGMTVLAGGQQYVVGGGTASGTQLMSQGVEIVHGTDLGATISGTQYVYGLASGTVVGTAGYQLVSAGGTTSGASISGGTIELQSGASNGPAPISFTGAGELILDASTTFSGTVANFGSASLADTIDFADISFVSSGSAGATTLTWSQLTNGANASGTLMVAQGGHSADITLLGQYLVGNFTPSNDGHGGTLVTDPPLALATDPAPTPQLAARHA